MQKYEAGLDLEQGIVLNQSIWMMCFVLGLREISLSVIVQLVITAFMGRMLVSSVEVKDMKYVDNYRIQNYST